MMPLIWQESALQLPHPYRSPAFEAGILPPASSCRYHLPGAKAKSGTSRYWDLNGFVWYYTGGMLTLNRGMKRIRRTARGVEDVAHRRG